DAKSNLRLYSRFQLTSESANAADINSDGIINQADLAILNNLLTNFVDLDRSGTINQGDVDRAREIVNFFNLGVSQQQFDLADINGDGIVDNADLAAMQDVLTHYVDVSGDGKVDSYDITIIERLSTLQVSLTTQEALRADVNGDGIINHDDYDLMRNFQSRLKDFNQDNKIDTKDLLRLKDIITAAGLKVNDKERQLADYNKDGTVDIFDRYALLNDIQTMADVNGDHIIDQFDILRLEAAIGNDKNVQDITIDQVNRADFVVDGIIDAADYNIVRDALQHAVDIDGNGSVGAEDIARLRLVIDFVKDGADVGEITRADLNQDGRITNDDVTAWEAAFNTLYGAGNTPIADFDGDGLVTSFDRVALANLVAKNPDQNLLKNAIRADVVKNRMINGEDLNAVKANVAKLVDVDKDGKVDQKDVDRINQIIELNQNAFSYDAATLQRADIDHDGKVTLADSQLFKDALTLLYSGWGQPRVDLTNDARIDNLDIQEMDNIRDFMEFQQQVNVGPLEFYDVDGNGTVNQADRDEIVLNMGRMVDLTKDGRVDQADRNRLALIVNGMIDGIVDLRYFYTTAEELQRANIDGDSDIDEDDKAAVDNAVRTFQTGTAFDINQDGKVDWDDVYRMTFILAMRSRQMLVTQDAVNKADINKDGTVSIADRLLLEDAIGAGSSDRELFDINGDSVVSEQDRDMLFHIWKFLDTRDLSHADINNDGIISNLDVS
ncbi:MAG: hypothetical protein HYZ83_01245, partial [Candidatus Omnitrophica bacterium]|nr:hypothetical protein [Candidatus Omnitrophota bacterium]